MGNNKNMKKNYNKTSFIQKIFSKKCIEHYADQLQEKQAEYTAVERTRPFRENTIEITDEHVKKPVERANNNRAPEQGNRTCQIYLKIKTLL